MFDIDLKPTFTRTAHMSIPSGSGFAAQSCSVTFEALDVDEFNSFDIESSAGAAKFLARTIVDIGDVIDKGGNVVPYSKAVRDRMIALPWARSAMIAAYLQGFVKAAEGN